VINNNNNNNDTTMFLAWMDGRATTRWKLLQAVIGVLAAEAATNDNCSQEDIGMGTAYDPEEQKQQQ
jgi:hypothetical protein